MLFQNAVWRRPKVFPDFKNWLIQATMYSNIRFRVFVPSLFGTIQGQWALFGKTKSISFFFSSLEEQRGNKWLLLMENLKIRVRPDIDSPFVNEIHSDVLRKYSLKLDGLKYEKKIYFVNLHQVINLKRLKNRHFCSIRNIFKKLYRAISLFLEHLGPPTPPHLFSTGDPFLRRSFELNHHIRQERWIAARKNEKGALKRLSKPILCFV